MPLSVLAHLSPWHLLKLDLGMEHSPQPRKRNKAVCSENSSATAAGPCEGHRCIWEILGPQNCPSTPTGGQAPHLPLCLAVLPSAKADRTRPPCALSFCHLSQGSPFNHYHPPQKTAWCCLKEGLEANVQALTPSPSQM
jgi:hypothetical protein